MRIDIFVATQTLDLLAASGELLRRYVVSTAEKGCGEQKGSLQTPRGRHVVRARIGTGEPLRTVFRGRRPTGEICDAALYQQHPQRDWILSRILWLSGCEPGFNRLGAVDTMQRYIYIHGTPDALAFGLPSSHGCIRMRNEDVLDLFQRVVCGTPVMIHEDGFNCEPPHVTVRYEAADWQQASELLFTLRHAVFVQEQGVPLELEIDEHDPEARHWLARAPSGRVIGTVRLTRDCHIGRLAVAADWRGHGVGSGLLQRAVAAARATGATDVSLAAQVDAIGFYAAQGFVASGEVFDDAGIPHRTMIYGLR